MEPDQELVLNKRTKFKNATLLERSLSFFILLAISLICIGLIDGAAYLLSDYVFSLGIAATFTSVLALSSPLVTCIRLWLGKTNIKLQWQLYLCFMVSCIFGCAYAIRKNITVLFISSIAGFFVQVITLVTTLYVNTSGHSKSAGTALEGKKHAKQTISVIKKLLKLLLFMLLILATSFVVALVSFKMPLESGLGTCYTISSLAPLLALASSVKTDVTYRKIEKCRNFERNREYLDWVQTIETFPLYTIVLNCTLWLMFGLLTRNNVIILTSLVSDFFAIMELLIIVIPPILICSTTSMVKLNRSAAKKTSSLSNTSSNCDSVEIYSRLDENLKVKENTPIEPESSLKIPVHVSNQSKSPYQGINVEISNKSLVLDFASILLPKQVWYRSPC